MSLAVQTDACHHCIKTTLQIEVSALTIFMIEKFDDQGREQVLWKNCTILPCQWQGTVRRMAEPPVCMNAIANGHTMSTKFASHPHPFSTDTMTIVLNDPTWLSTIIAYRFYSYFAVAAFVGVAYDWALTFAQEVELIWRQRWSLITVLYLGVRYLGIFFAAYVRKAKHLIMLSNVLTIELTDTMLDYVHRTGLDACFGISNAGRKILIFLIVTFLAVNIFDGVVAIMTAIQTSGVWVAVKHFREQRLPSEDCLIVLMKTHMLYFARVGRGSFVAVSCFELIIDFSPTLSAILQVVQMVVLGPRLILSVREYSARLVADSDAATGARAYIDWQYALQRAGEFTPTFVMVLIEVIWCSDVDFEFKETWVWIMSSL
ncbi:uncharacterized protein HD556DRAFT_1307719 [Suillus plorans]|uniref:DUF6533 domain-containing protein n=1 Tax=Suillus plorans TaxID=116603 RepID=A0A9P7DJ83_9AGAM|nr:uncharacterized protein HD556DRAFT_1307719 [Suillus plorans]KAG1795128.1 hypothetical protein HD556DRAFT_1307719 [Suillus plorans]